MSPPVDEQRLGMLLQALRCNSNMFHEIGAAFSAEKLGADARNAKITALLREQMRSRDQLVKIAADDFKLCVRAFAAMGATDVTIYGCGKEALDETPWSGENGA